MHAAHNAPLPKEPHTYMSCPEILFPKSAQKLKALLPSSSETGDAIVVKAASLVWEFFEGDGRQGIDFMSACNIIMQHDHYGMRLQVEHVNHALDFVGQNDEHEDEDDEDDEDYDPEPSSKRSKVSVGGNEDADPDDYSDDALSEEDEDTNWADSDIDDDDDSDDDWDQSKIDQAEEENQFVEAFTSATNSEDTTRISEDKGRAVEWRCRMVRRRRGDPVLRQVPF